MKSTCYEIEKGKIRQQPICSFGRNKGQGFIQICDIGVTKREEAVQELQAMMIDGKILEALLNPSEHIMFEFIGDFAYGELAYFSAGSEDPVRYLGVIQNGKTIVFIHDQDEPVIQDFFQSLPKLVEYPVEKLGAPFILFVLIREIISSNGKLIVSYRDEVEEADKGFDQKLTGWQPSDFKLFNTHLSDFSRTIEKQYYSFSFPPTRSLIDQESAYARYFKELIKTLDLLKESLEQTEKRLNSLHDHYNLTLQQKSNKRLNFLTIIQAVFVPLTLLTGIYGMNWAFMPELNFRYGYFIFMGLMLLIALLFVRYFYKHGWFE